MQPLVKYTRPVVAHVRKHARSKSTSVAVEHALLVAFVQRECFGERTENVWLRRDVIISLF